MRRLSLGVGDSDAGLNKEVVVFPDPVVGDIPDCRAAVVRYKEGVANKELDVTTITIASTRQDRQTGTDARVDQQIPTLLLGVLWQLRGISTLLSDSGRDQEAHSVATVIADLEWQHSQLKQG